MQILLASIPTSLPNKASAPRQRVREPKFGRSPEEVEANVEALLKKREE